MIVEFGKCETLYSLRKRRIPSGWKATLCRQCRHKSNSNTNANAAVLPAGCSEAQEPNSGTPSPTLKLYCSLQPIRLFICHSDIEVIKHKISAKHSGAKIFSSACELISTHCGGRIGKCAQLLHVLCSWNSQLVASSTVRHSPHPPLKLTPPLLCWTRIGWRKCEYMCACKFYLWGRHTFCFKISHFHRICHRIYIHTHKLSAYKQCFCYRRTQMPGIVGAACRQTTIFTYFSSGGVVREGGCEKLALRVLNEI